MNDRHRRSRLAAFCLLQRDGRVLLAKGDYGFRYWALPGGVHVLSGPEGGHPVHIVPPPPTT